MADINLNNLDGIPFGIDSGRPSNPQPGQPYFNGQSNRLEIYTQSVGWQNVVQETPSIVSVTGNAKESTSSTLTINGTNFAAGCIAYAVGTNATEYSAITTTLVSAVQLTVTFPALNPAYEPYDVKVVNPSNLYGVLYDSLNVDATPVWTTGSGSLGTYLEQSAMSVQVSATDASDPSSSALIYSISSGSLPPGISINSATGVISGTPANLSSNTTYSFTANAYDGMNNVTRNFSITITDRAPTWVTSSALPTFTKNSAYSTTLQATDEDNVATISYSLFSGSLPSGLSLASNGIISGTPTGSTPATFTIRATDSLSASYADRQFTMANVGPSWVTSSPLTVAVLNQSYSNQLSATDDSGVSPTYSLISGSLPSGITLSSSGLLSGTSSSPATYSFTIRATDGNGTASDRAFTLDVIAIGATLYQTAGTYTWTAPAGVTSVSVVAIGPGGNGGGGAVDGAGGGGGGGLGWINNYSVTPGSGYTVVVGSPGTDSYFSSTSVVRGGSGTNGNTVSSGGAVSGGGYTGTGGGNGGNGGSGTSADATDTIIEGGGGGGAGGYSGNGGNGAYAIPSTPATAGSGGAAGGGGGTDGGGYGGGGVGPYGQGASGTAGPDRNDAQNNGGSGGSAGGSPAGGALTTGGDGGPGGNYGGGGGGDDSGTGTPAGARGAVRIVWGSGRSFPSTNVGQNYLGIAETVI